jgi:hypothetical protein
MPSGTSLVAASATLAAVNAEVRLGPLADHNCAVVKLAGNLAGTVECQVSMDSLSWNNCLCEQANGEDPGAPDQVVAGNEMLFANIAGYPWVRFRVSAYTSGTCVATARATVAVPRIMGVVATTTPPPVEP